MALRIRRGTDAERQTITPKSGELLYVTDTGLIYVGDGTTQGGSLVSASLENDDSPSLSANLNLNGNDIVGNGNINIDGNITATGNINIGDGVEDNVIVGGTISSDLIPTTDTAFDLGSENFRWQNGHFTGMFVDGNVFAGSLSVGDIFAQDSTVIYDTETQTFEANFKGSLFGDDSSPIVDAINNTITAAEVQSNLIASDIFSGFLIGDVGSDEETILIDIELNAVTASNFIPNNNLFSIFSNSEGDMNLESAAIEGTSVLSLTKQSSSDLSGDQTPDAAIQFTRIDVNGSLTTARINGGGSQGFVYITADSAGLPSINQEAATLTWGDTKLGIGTFLPNANLDVQGNAIINGHLESSTATADILSTDSSLLIDAENGEILGTLRDIELIGTAGTSPDNDNPTQDSPTEWLQIIFNGNTRYIPLYI